MSELDDYRNMQDDDPLDAATGCLWGLAYVAALAIVGGLIVAIIHLVQLLRAVLP